MAIHGKIQPNRMRGKTEMQEKIEQSSRTKSCIHVYKLINIEKKAYRLSAELLSQSLLSKTKKEKAQHD